MSSRHSTSLRFPFRPALSSGTGLVRVLTTLIALTVAWLWLTFFLWQPPDVHWPETGLSNTAPASANLSLATDFSLFGANNAPTDHAQAPVSTLELRLTGTMASEDPTTGLAFLDNKKGRQKSFRPGDDVFGLAQLVAVYPDYVLLRHNGREEKVPLATPGSFASKNRQPSPRQPPSTTLPGIRTGQSSGAQQEKMDEIREKFQVDPEEIARHIQVVPVVEGTGGLSGLRVSALRQGDLLQKVGLRSNDLIIAVNGVNISPANMLQLTQQLDGANQVDLTIRRNGRTQTLSVDLSALSRQN